MCIWLNQLIKKIMMSITMHRLISESPQCESFMVPKITGLVLTKNEGRKEKKTVNLRAVRQSEGHALSLSVSLARAL